MKVDESTCVGGARRLKAFLKCTQDGKDEILGLRGLIKYF